MKDYLMTVVALSVGLGILGLTLPRDENNSIGQAVSLVGALALLLFIISPLGKLPSLVSSLGAVDLDSALTSNGDVYGALWLEKTREITGAELEKYIRELVSDEFGIDAEVVCVPEGEDETDIGKWRAEICIEATSLVNPRRIEERVSEVPGVDCCVKEASG